jgi:hypothetical protein
MSAPIRAPIVPDTYASGGARRNASARATAAATRGGTSMGTAMPTPGTTWASRLTTIATIAVATSIRPYMRVRTKR